MIVSDHGMGGTSDRVLYLNRYLEQCGFLKFGVSTAGAQSISRLKTAGLKWVPYRWQQGAFKIAGGRLASVLESRQRFSGIDWTRTKSYSEELNYFPAIRLNRVGREAGGIVNSEDITPLCDEIKAALLEWRDPEDGRTVVMTVHAREEIYNGSETNFAPDLILELTQPEGFCYALGRSTSPEGREPWRRLKPNEHLGFKGVSMNGSHRSKGIFTMRGGEERRVLPDDFSLSDVAPLVLKELGVDLPIWMKRPSASNSSRTASPTPPALEIPYSSAQEESLRQRLAGLGYL
jgi:predicted AlkP superfamily phosphohydrolase/phosphomutase